MPIRNLQEANLALQPIRDNARTNDMNNGRAKNPDPSINYNQQGYKKFLNAISKLFHVQSKCCAVTVEGELTEIGDVLKVKEMRFTYNDRLTFGNFTFNILGDNFEDVVYGQNPQSFRSGVFAYSRMVPKAKTLISEVYIVMKTYRDYLNNYNGDLLEIATVEYLCDKLDRALQKCAQITRNSGHANVATWGQEVMQIITHILPETGRIINDLGTEYNKAGHGDISQYDPNNLRKLKSVLDNFGNYEMCTNNVIDFALHNILILDTAGAEILSIKQYIDPNDEGRTLHTELQQLYNNGIFDNNNIIPYLGISLLCCGMCYNVIRSEANIRNINIRDLVPGTHGIFFPEDWSVPNFCFRDDIAQQNLEALIQLAGNYANINDVTQTYFLQ